MFNFNMEPVIIQAPLFQYVNEDDAILESFSEAEWYRTLKDFPWRDYRDLGADYYDALYDFNRTKNNPPPGNNDESKQEAAERLLNGRPTVDKSLPVIYQPNFKSPAEKSVHACSIAPGITPHRLGGKKPKCFFAMYKSFIGASLLGMEPVPETVRSLLASNLSFARVCGFIPKESDGQYWQHHIPSLRKIEQFDQIMTEYGLWSQSKLTEVRENIENGIIKEENIIVGDTTHYYGFSSFETVVYQDEAGNEKRKSQSKPTKNCRCEDQEKCNHPWILTDDGAGTIVKQHKKIIWGHKASIIGLPLQGIPLDAIAISDAASFDGITFYPHVCLLFENLPEVQNWFDIALYDSACDIQKLKDDFLDNLDIQLKTSMNPRRRKTIFENLPVGMEKLTPFGNLYCNGGYEMDYKGVRFDDEKFIYESPFTEDGVYVCSGCKHKETCSPNSNKVRTVTIPFAMLPHIDVNDPPMAKRFKNTMKLRPSVERMIKRLKCDLSDDRLRKRGNNSFQAYLDKTMTAFHILLRR